MPPVTRLKSSGAAVNIPPQKQSPMDSQPTRSSRRVRGLAPQSYVPPPKPVFLPPELKVDVLARLDKRDLKSVRLVSKEWNALATGPLFDRVYFSCREKDLEVWENVTRHPVIGGVVKEVIYDGSLFKDDLTISDYFWELYHYLPYITLDFWSEPFNSADHEINAFVEDYKNKAIRGIFNRHKGDAFILEGYRNHQKYAEFERRGLKNGMFLSKICGGLRCLDNLRSVILSDNVWQYDFQKHKWYGSVKSNTLHGPDSGSPLVRSWNPLHLRPFVWNCDEIKDERLLICDHFYTLTAAITETHRNIKSLEIPFGIIGGSLPRQALTRPRMTDDLYYRTLHAYSGLEVLDISIDLGGGDQDSDDLEALALLPRMLHQMIGLKKLTLHLSKDADRHLGHMNTTECYTYQQVFPPLAVWPKLTKLWIMGLAIGGYDLIRLLRGRARVKDLSLHCIELLDGTWEGVFEGLCHMRLENVRLIDNFKHRGGQLFAPHKMKSRFTDTEVLKAVEDYVICGGRHPCLTPESGPEIAVWWYLELLPEKELEDLKVTARRNDLDIDDFFRNRPSSAPAQTLIGD